MKKIILFAAVLIFLFCVIFALYADRFTVSLGSDAEKRVLKIEFINGEKPDFTYDWNADPIGKALYQKLPPMLETVMARYKNLNQYPPEKFPLNKEEHHTFREKIVKVLTDSMSGSGGSGQDWIVKSAESENTALHEKYEINKLSTVNVDGLDIHLFTIFIKDTGDIVPAAICYPSAERSPAVVAFSGHTHYGLRELFVDKESYQRAIAWHLCKAGFVSASVGKIDSGTSSILFQKKGERWRENIWADDEDKIATTLIGIGDYLIPGRQLMANIALLEYVAQNPRVDKDRIGAVGISLGGWLTLQLSLVNDRLKAIANFGGMWSYLDEYVDQPEHEDFVGINDYSQLFPGIWQLGDQSRFIFAAAPVPMLTGYGLQDVPYVNFKKYFHPKISQQYELLGKKDDIEVIVHEEGHVFPEEAVIDYFKRRL